MRTAHAGCEAIAVYNTLHDMGKDVGLSQIIYDTEKNGYMVANGWMGTKTWKVDDMLRQYGVESTTAKPETVQRSADSGKLKDGQVYVASIWNNTNDKTGLADIGSGIHTFEVVYSPSANTDMPWVVYNRNSKEGEQRYKSIDEILVDEGMKGKYLSMLEVLN